MNEPNEQSGEIEFESIAYDRKIDELGEVYFDGGLQTLDDNKYGLYERQKGDGLSKVEVLMVGSGISLEISNNEIRSVYDILPLVNKILRKFQLKEVSASNVASVKMRGIASFLCDGEVVDVSVGEEELRIHIFNSGKVEVFAQIDSAIGFLFAK